MHRAFETFLERLSETIDETELRDIMAGTARELGLRMFAYLSLPSIKTERAGIISNYPKDWLSRYADSGYARIDPVILRAADDASPFQWEATLFAAGDQSPQRQLFGEAAEFGIRRGLTIPIHDRRGRIAAMTFAADERDPAFLRVAERYGQALQLLATCFHIRLRQTGTGDRVVDGTRLTPRELECLKWAARGKSAWEIGCILGIRRRTAAFHLDNARRKLGVRTITQAVVRLASAGPSTR